MTATQDVNTPCNVFVEIVTDYLEGALSSDEVAIIDAHLAVCPGCVSVVEQLRATTRLARRIRQEDVDELDPALRADLMAAFREAAERRTPPV